MFAAQFHMARVGIRRLGKWFHGLGWDQGKKWEKREKENNGLISFDGNYLLFLDTSVRNGR